jgi:TM2 domain-containing membrane protein YozV
MSKIEGKDWKLEVLPKDKEPKSIMAAYYMFFLLGTFGMHHFYLGHKKRGIYILSLVWMPILIGKYVAPLQHYQWYLIGSVIMVGPLLVYDAFMLWSQVKQYNLENYTEEERRFVEV